MNIQKKDGFWNPFLINLRLYLAAVNSYEYLIWYKINLLYNSIFKTNAIPAGAATFCLCC
jgi:hypothetical protein